MVDFHESVTGVLAERLTPTFAVLRYPSCTLGIGRTSRDAPRSNAAGPAPNRTVIIEWVVDDVDAEYERLQPLVSEWEQEPKTMPWGNRSILFSDPDGNLIDFFTPVTEDAVTRFNGQPPV